LKVNILPSIWIRLLGHPDHFNKEHRAFNAVAFLSLCLLLLLLPFNIYLGLEVVFISTAVIFIALAVVYFLSRMGNNYKLGRTIYAVVSYVFLSLNFYYNAGYKGPTIYFFFLTFQLILAFSIIKRHLLFTIMHLVVVSSLLIVEYCYPERFIDIYQSRFDHFLDLLSSSIAVIIGMYLVTRYLLSSYEREKKKAEERELLITAQNAQLQKLNQEKTKILSILGHDLRSPLNSITTVLNVLANYPLPEEHRLRLQKELLDTTRNTSEMLMNLLSWSSEQMQGIEPKLISVNVQMVLQKVLENQQFIAQSKEIKFTTYIDQSIYVLADYNMLEVVLRNLINNAIKFTAPLGMVTIAAQKTDDSCLISIQDNGIGMSEEQLSTLFTMDIHSTYGTNNEKGIGLGLVLCKDFTELQGGKIWVESTVGQGSVFYISLPLRHQ